MSAANLRPETWFRHINVAHADPLTALNMSCHETNLGKKKHFNIPE
jgi:hypothetical protein